MAPVNTLANYPGLSWPPGQVLRQRRIAPPARTAVTAHPVAGGPPLRSARTWGVLARGVRAVPPGI